MSTNDPNCGNGILGAAYTSGYAVQQQLMQAQQGPQQGQWIYSTQALTQPLQWTTTTTPFPEPPLNHQFVCSLLALLSSVGEELTRRWVKKIIPEGCECREWKLALDIYKSKTEDPELNKLIEECAREISV